MNIFNLFRKKTHLIKPTLLIIYDGWGIAPDSPGNAILKSKTPNFNFYMQNYPNSAIIASGESVGLPANVVGNSEVGHLTIGAGRVIDESLVRINKSIDNGTFFDNEALLNCTKHVIASNSKLHIVGMASSGNVHSSLMHLYALMELAKRQKVSVVLHLFTDGRDAAPMDGLNVLKEIEGKLSEYPNVKIGSIAGRYYAMDRDGRWDRTKLVYENIVEGTGPSYKTASEAISAYYAKAITDEFITPTLIIDGEAQSNFTLNDNDGLIFFNFRVDRARQLAMSFILPNFENLHEYDWGFDLDQGNKKVKRADGPTFIRKKVAKNLFIVSITEYQKQLPVNGVAFPTTKVENSLSEVVSRASLKQYHLAESEKERMVTYYFDGLTNERFEGETVEIVSSPKVSTYDKKPEMSVFQLVKKIKSAINIDTYTFLVMNIANPDMVAHTGNLEATIKAIEAVDKATGEIVDAVLDANGRVIITADHGNAEELITYNQAGYFFTTETGSMNTEHSNNPVPLIIIDRKYLGYKNILKNGRSGDVAPTILSLMGIKVPDVMTGVNLLTS